MNDWLSIYFTYHLHVNRTMYAHLLSKNACTVRFFSKTYMFLLPTYLLCQHFFCGTLICPIDLSTRFKIGMYLLNKEKRY